MFSKKGFCRLILILTFLIFTLNSSAIAQKQSLINGKITQIHGESKTTNNMSTILDVGEPIDYSDAPGSYGLASHRGIIPDIYRPNGFVEWLGPEISADASPPTEDTYDDGVSWTPMQAGQNFDFTYSATFGTDFACSERVNVEAWIDYNQNGLFDTGEKVLDRFDRIYSEAAISWCGVDPSLVPTTITQSITVPPEAQFGNTWMRVRLWYYDPDDLSGIEQDSSPTGEIQWGEVEDYEVTIGPSNLIQNPSFEIDDDANTIPDFWSPSGFVAGDGRSSDFAKEGNYSLKMSGNPTTAKSASQIIAVGGTAGEQITVSGWNKTEGSTTAGRCVVALIYFNNTDGSRKYAGYLFFGRNTHDWLERSVSIIAEKDYSSIDIKIGYFYQTGTAYFDDFKLLK